MGQDIHIKSFLWSKVENKYIDGMSLTSCPQYSPCKPFFDGRYYDFFSIFGSGRGQFKELSGGNFGIPDFLPETFKKYLQCLKGNYYTFSWFKIGELKNSLEDYIRQLEDPKNYYEDDEDMLAEISSGEFDESLWKEETVPLLSTIQRVLKRISSLEDEFVVNSNIFDQLIDVQKTVFLIYFDS